LIAWSPKDCQVPQSTLPIQLPAGVPLEMKTTIDKKNMVSPHVPQDSASVVSYVKQRRRRQSTKVCVEAQLEWLSGGHLDTIWGLHGTILEIMLPKLRKHNMKAAHELGSAAIPKTNRSQWDAFTCVGFHALGARNSLSRHTRESRHTMAQIYCLLNGGIWIIWTISHGKREPNRFKLHIHFIHGWFCLYSPMCFDFKVDVHYGLSAYPCWAKLMIFVSNFPACYPNKMLLDAHGHSKGKDPKSLTRFITKLIKFESCRGSRFEIPPRMA
jgi:hypothetical protein